MDTKLEFIYHLKNTTKTLHKCQEHFGVWTLSWWPGQMVVAWEGWALCNSQLGTLPCKFQIGWRETLRIFIYSWDVRFSSIQLLSHVQLLATPWIAARQASLFITSSRSSLRLTSIKSVMPSSHLILCRPLLLLPPIPPSIRVFSTESTLRMRWPKYWSFSFSIMPSKEHLGLRGANFQNWGNQS